MQLLFTYLKIDVYVASEKGKYPNNVILASNIITHAVSWTRKEVLTRGILTSFRFGGLPGGGGGFAPPPPPLPIFYLWTDFDDFFFWVLLITSTLQNISHFFSMTTMTSDMDIFRLPVYRKITFFLVFGSQLFCSTFAQHFFGLKLTPEIIVIEIIYQHVWEKSISL